MSFEGFEEGPEGYPVELYKFDRGLSQSYYYTSADADREYQSNNYETLQIQRDAIEVNSEMERASIKVRLQRDAGVLNNFIGFPPTEIINLTIFRYHENDGVTPEVVVVWQGRVLAANWEGSQASIDCEPVFTSLKRPGLRRKYQAQCPHILYGAKCKLDRFVYAVTTNLTAVNGAVVTSPDFAIAADYFFGGYMSFDNREFRTIIGDDGAGNLTLAHVQGEITVGSQVQAFPGCAHNLADCKDKYNNILNYGGFPYVPGVNPFGGTILF